MELVRNRIISPRETRGDLAFLKIAPKRSSLEDVNKGDVNKGDAVFDEQEPESPVLQIISYKPIQSGVHGRYRLHLSDGLYSTCSSMLATHLNEMISKELTSFTIIRADRFVCNVVSQLKKVMIILDLTVLASGDTVGKILGSPVMFDTLDAATQAEAAKGIHKRVPLEPVSMNQSGSRILNEPAARAPKASGLSVGIHPIASLTPYQNKWTICARVTSKSDIRTWSNSRGQGKLFSFDLLDESGEIKVTAFNEQCDKFFNIIEIDKVYYISQAQLKTANKQYSSLKNDYEMSFNQGTQVNLCQEQTAIPKMQFQFVNIEQLESVDKDSVIDVIGVCKGAEDISTVIQKSTGRELKKRDLQIVDDSGKEVRLTLWGTQAENFDGSLNPVVAIKGARVSDFNGKSLSVLSSSTVQINPDIKESHKLRAWYENVGSNMQTVNLSNQRGGAGGVGSNIKTIGEAIAENLGYGDQPDYYTTKGLASLIRKENCLYAACPSEGCNKKVTDMNTGSYRCEKCNKEYDTFKWRLMLQLSIADCTDNVWCTAFQDQAELILGCSSTDMGMMREQDDNAFQAVIDEASFKEFIFKFRVKTEVYNDERRLRTSVVSVQHLDPKEYNKILIQQIKSMAGVGV